MELIRAERRERGFSAIETLVALCILMIGLSAVSTGLTEGLRIAATADQRQRAIWLADDKVTEKLGLGYDAAAVPADPTEHVERGTLVGEDEQDGIVRRWRVEPDWPRPGSVRVFVATQWMRRGELQTYTVAGLLAKGLTP
ncbi:MAG: type IV pilus modification PilV family protein [Nitrospirota bacterium]